jgi:hypothetical protein
MLSLIQPINIPKSIFNNHFMSPLIHNYIIKNGSSFIEESTTIGKSTTNGDLNGNDSITIYTINKESNMDAAFRIYTEISNIAKLYAEVPRASKMCCYIYLTDFPKKLDTEKDNITSSECNTATTTFYMQQDYIEVAIWRREEWQKVFYHELVHAFGIDQILVPDSISEEKLKSIFPHYNGTIQEAYTEVLATLLSNISQSGGSLTSLKDENLFLSAQVNKIIYFMESTPEERVELGRNSNRNNINDKTGIEKIKKFFINPVRYLDQSTNTGSYYFLKSMYLWYGIYKDNKLLDLKNILDKKYCNGIFYQVVLDALEKGEYLKWLESIYFKPNDTSIRLTYKSE